MRVFDDESTTCEDKLATLKNIITEKSPYESSDSTSLKIATPEAKSVGPTTEDRFEKVLSQISGINDKKVAKTLLEEIEKSSKISWDFETLEIVIDGEQLKYTNIVYLIKRVITVNPASIPLGLTLFLDALMKIKAPMTLIKNGDAKQILENLQKINDAAAAQSESSTTETPSSESTSSETTSSEGNSYGKRSRDEDVDEELEPSSKRVASDALTQDSSLADDNDAKQNFGLESATLKGIRRSPRLKAEIEKAWKSSNESGSSKPKFVSKKNSRRRN